MVPLVLSANFDCMDVAEAMIAAELLIVKKESKEKKTPTPLNA